MAKEAATAVEEPVASEAPAENAVEDGNRERAASIVTKYAAAAAAAGLIPIPAADIAAISAVQVKMLHSLSKLYGVPFSEQWARSSMASLTGSVAADGIGRVGLGSMLKLIPGIGHVASMFALPGVAWGVTSALGQIFTRHFEDGGTLLNLNLKVWRPIFYDKVETATQQN
jgi:uncharacterized protein (DUF697 family)